MNLLLKLATNWHKQISDCFVCVLSVERPRYWPWTCSRIWSTADINRLVLRQCMFVSRGAKLPNMNPLPKLAHEETLTDHAPLQNSLFLFEKLKYWSSMLNKRTVFKSVSESLLHMLPDISVLTLLAYFEVFGQLPGTRCMTDASVCIFVRIVTRILYQSRKGAGLQLSCNQSVTISVVFRPKHGQEFSPESSVSADKLSGRRELHKLRAYMHVHI